MTKNAAPQALAPDHDPLTPWLGRIHTGDCLDLLPGLPSGSVDMVFADLPY
jgi:DNA modification methylase